eukprot:3320173-Pyramimonas_sp.AAC.1
MPTHTRTPAASDWRLNIRSYLPYASSTTPRTIGVRVVIKGAFSATPSPPPTWSSLAWTQQ